MNEDLEKTIDELKQKGRYWNKLIEEFPERFIFPKHEGSHYIHITGNLISTFAIMRLIPNNVIMENPELIEWAKRDDKSYEIYFKLLEEFPEYRKAELTIERYGYFPDIKDTGEGGAVNYVFESEKRLRDKK